MSDFNFLDLPFEIRENIYAAYTESIVVGFDSRTVPGNMKYSAPIYEKYQPIVKRYQWYIGLDTERMTSPQDTQISKRVASEQTLESSGSELKAPASTDIDRRSHSRGAAVEHELPGLLLASKQLHAELMAYLGQHKQLHVPHHGPFWCRDLPRLEGSLETQIPSSLCANVKHLVFENMVIRNSIKRPYILATGSESLIDTLVGLLPALKRITLLATDSLALARKGCIDYTDVAYGDPAACEAAAKVLARFKNIVAGHPVLARCALSSRDDGAVFLNLNLKTPHKGFCCHKPGRIAWTIQVVSLKDGSSEVVSIEKVARPDF